MKPNTKYFGLNGDVACSETGRVAIGCDLHPGGKCVNYTTASAGISHKNRRFYLAGVFLAAAIPSRISRVLRRRAIFALRLALNLERSPLRADMNSSWNRFSVVLFWVVLHSP